MAAKKIKNRLPFASRSGPDPSFPLDDDAFEAFEDRLRRQIDANAREDLEAICDQYLADLASERLWQTYGDVLGLLSNVDNAAKAMWRFAIETDHRSDAQAALDAMLEKELPRQLVPLNPARGELLHLLGDGPEGWVSFAERFEVPDGAYAVGLNIDLFRRITMSLRVAVNNVRREIENRNERDADQDRFVATDVFYLHLRDWAKKHDIPRSEYIGSGEPAAFAEFVSEIMNRVPDEWWLSNRDTTPGAVAMQIKRAKKAVKQRKAREKGQKP